MKNFLWWEKTEVSERNWILEPLFYTAWFFFPLFMPVHTSAHCTMRSLCSVLTGLLPSSSVGRRWQKNWAILFLGSASFDDDDRPKSSLHDVTNITHLVVFLCTRALCTSQWLWVESLAEGQTEMAQCFHENAWIALVLLRNEEYCQMWKLSTHLK